jgi:uncharacterized protein
MSLRPPPLWPVVVAYLLAFVTVVVFSGVAAVVVHSPYPELADRALFEGLPGLLAGGIASSTALLVTLLAVARPLEATRLRLRPGRERGLDVAAATVGTLALGQTLDSLTVLLGLGDHGALAMIRDALAGARGAELFVAVLVIGGMAGTAEEVFFRGFLQSRLRERWSPTAAVVAASAGFGLFHLEWLHALLAFALGLYLGFVTERLGSALPAVAAHVVNNVLFTVLTATVGSPVDVAPNLLLLGAGALIFVACVARVARRGPA